MNVTAKLPPVIVLGGDSNALSVARRLGRMGVRVYGIGVAPFVRHSRFLEHVPVPPCSDAEAAWARTLLGPGCAHLRGAVLLAGSDVGIAVLAHNRDRLLEHFLLDISDTAVQLMMLDKLATYERAVEAGVPTPRFWRIDEAGDLDRYRDELVFPLIVKPLHSHQYQAAFPGLSKFRIARNLDELVGEHRALADAGIAVMLVEKIVGPDDLLCSYYTYIDGTGTPTFDFTKRILRRHPPNMGIATYHITDWNAEVRDVAQRLFKHVGLLGVANAEFKRDVRDGQLKLIECNARFTAANCLVAAAGIDLARFVYMQIVGRPEPLPDQYQTGLRLLYPSNDMRAFLDLRATGQLTLGGWLRSLAHRQTFPFMSWRDPLPAVARGARRLGRGTALVVGTGRGRRGAPE